MVRIPKAQVLAVMALVSLLAASCVVDGGVAAPPDPRTLSTAESLPADIPVPPTTPIVEPEGTVTPAAVPTVIPTPEVPFWESQGHVSAIAWTVAVRFNVDEDPTPLGLVFFPSDQTSAEALDDCFDRETRNLLGDDVVDQANRAGTAQASEYVLTGSDALVRCVAPARVRDASLGTLVDGWSLYGPRQFPASIDDQCVQAIHPTEPQAFVAQWTTVRLPQAGSCLDQRLQEMGPLPAVQPEATVAGDSLAGRRGLTLQWISWEPEEWGSIEFVALGNETYQVAGEQQGPDGAKLIVDGTIIRVSARELRFDGDITTRVPYIQDGAGVCSRSGQVDFVATDDRQFWRMQDLLSCDGIVTDYVDIYFG